MQRFLVIGAFGAAALVLLVLSFVFRSDQTRRENMIGNRGRIGRQDAIPHGFQTWNGILVDAGCPDRDSSTGQDTSCAVTGGTRAFAIYLPGGELKNFDEGGNTKIIELFQGTSQGQAVFNGRAHGFKPRVEVKGKMWDDRIAVESVRLLS